MDLFEDDKMISFCRQIQFNILNTSHTNNLHWLLTPVDCGCQNLIRQLNSESFHFMGIKPNGRQNSNWKKNWFLPVRWYELNGFDKISAKRKYKDTVLKRRTENVQRHH
jgi:hypothetical protein